MAHGDDCGRLTRRQWLGSTPNPAPRLDTQVCWSGTLADGRALTLEYVPDRRVLRPDAFAAYLDSLNAAPWPTLEALVSAILDDINNELVPRWVRVSGTQNGAVSHRVTASDRQPGWDTAALRP